MREDEQRLPALAAVSMAPGDAGAAFQLARVLYELAASAQPEQQAADLDRALELIGRFQCDCQADPARLRLQAAVASRRGRWDVAARAIARSLELDGEQPEAHTLQGEVHLQAGNRPLALESFLKALALDPGLEEAACRAIAFLEGDGHLVQARQIMERVVEKRPLSRRARLALARLCSRLGDHRAAALHWEAAARQSPLSGEELGLLAAAYVSQARYADAERINAVQLTADPKALGPLLLAGDIARAAGRTAEARTRFEQAARLHPRSADCPSRLADLYRNDGRLQDALLQVRRALELEPAKAALHLEHGKVLSELERHEAAREAFEKAAASAGPHQREALLALGRTYRRLDNRRQALETLEKLVEDGAREGPSLVALRELADLHFERGDWPRAAEAFEQLRAKLPGLDMPAKERLSLCYARMGMTAKGTGVLRELASGGKASVEVIVETARAHLRQGSQREALALLAEHAPGREAAARSRLHLEMARIHHRAGDRRASEADLMAAIELKPDDGEAQAEIASYLEETGQLELMRTTFARITDRYPSDPRALCFLGAACLKLGRARDARDVFGRAVKLDYNLFAAHAGLARALRSEGDVASAVDEYRKAQFLAPKNARLVFELATALSETSQLGGASASFEKVLELEPSSSALATAARENLHKLRAKG